MVGSESLQQRKLLRLLDRSGSGSLSTLVQSACPAAIRLGGAFLQLLATILIARGLGAKESGVYFFWTAAMMEAGQVATFGLDRLALQRVPRMEEKEDGVRRFLAPLRTTTLLLSLVGAVLLCLYALFFQQEGDWPTWWYVLPFLAATGITLGMVNSEALTGLGRPVAAILFRHTLPVLTVLTVVLIAGDQLSKEIALAAYAAGFFLFGFGALYAPGLRSQGRKLEIPDLPTFRTHLSLGFPIFLASLFAALSFLIPLSVLEQTRSPEEIALLTTAFRIFVLVDVLARAVHSIQMPGLSRTAEGGNGADIWRIYRSALVRGMMLLAFPVLGLILLARFAMMIFGPEFADGAPLLQVLLGFGLFSLALGPAHQLLLMIGHTGRMALFSFVLFSFTGVLAFLVIPSHGGMGAAVVIGLGLALEKGLLLGYSIRAVRRNQREEETGEGESDG